jgi:hypothetical protein
MAWFLVVQGRYVSGFSNSVSKAKTLVEAMKQAGVFTRYDGRTVISALEISDADVDEYNRARRSEDAA